MKTAAAFVFAGMPLAEDEELVDFDDLSNFRVENHAELPRVRFFDLRHLTSLNTPEDEFFTFHQTQTPRIDSKTWMLRVDGFVEKARQFTLDQIRQRADKRDLAVTIECSGNVAAGAANGMVSSGVWTGVGLSSLLKECGLKPETREVVFFGADLERERPDAVEIPHGRSVYLQDALDPNAMLAFALNGKPLGPDRGFPLRVIVPGWYGMTHIKWLSRIMALDRRFEGIHMSRNYHTLREGDLAIETSISRTRLKSVVARVTRKRDAAGRFAYRIAGAAWGGPSPLKSVEVSTDGTAWRPAKLVESGGPFAWALWTLDWPDVRPGGHTIVSRAIDVAGSVQPTGAEWKQSVKTLREDNSQWLRRLTVKGGGR